jgi:CIC family chloride channel protein
MPSLGPFWRRLRASTEALFRRHWQKLLLWRDRLRFSEDAFHLLLAGGVGLVGGLTNLAYSLCQDSLVELSLGRAGDPGMLAEALGPVARVMTPALGGLAAGLVLHWGLRLAGPQGPSHLLEVVVAGDGRLPLRSALIKGISSLLSISTGASIGREGLVTQLSATFASKGGQYAGWPPYRLRLLVACGAASAMAAAYNAPIAGSVFAAQIVLGNFSMNLFAPLVFASVVATVVSRNILGLEPLYHVPSFDFTHLWQLPWFLVLGFLAGMLGVALLKLIQRSEAAFRGTGWPAPVRIALAGVLVGILALAYPQVWGNGYGATNSILDHRFGLMTLAGLLAAKLAATVICVGSGTVGGVFTPTLFLGAALGSLMAALLHAAGWALELPGGTFALAGMGSVLAATTHSPLLAMIMGFEICLNYSLMPALMLACVVATLVARSLHPSTIYTEPLEARGITASRETDQLGTATQLTVGDLMQEPVGPVAVTASFRDVANRFLTSSNNFLPVTDDRQRLVGVVALHDLKQHLGGGEDIAGVIAFDVMQPPPPCLTPCQRLLEALPVLLSSEQRNIPVVNDLQERRLIGSIGRAEALGMLSEAIAIRSATRT